VRERLVDLPRRIRRELVGSGIGLALEAVALVAILAVLAVVAWIVLVVA
jgi:hypothetical protein